MRVVLCRACSSCTVVALCALNSPITCYHRLLLTPPHMRTHEHAALYRLPRCASICQSCAWWTLTATIMP